MPSWKKVLISGSDAALNSLNITAALTASGISYPSADGTAGQALVTNGSGQLSFTTLDSGGIGSSVKLSQTAAATTWSFEHNLNEKFPAITIYDSNDEVIIPQKIDAIDNDNMLIYFSTPRTGTAAAVVGGSTVSASYAQTASHALYALTASYLEGYVSPFPFTGSAIITGSLEVTGSTYLSGILEVGGNILPKTAQGATLGTVDRPFSEIFVSSGSINIASDTPSDPNTSISNVEGNLLISAGGMRLLGSASFIAETGSFQYISGSMTQEGDYNQTGNYTLIGDKTITGLLSVSGSTHLDGNIVFKSGSTTPTGSLGSIEYNGTAFFATPSSTQRSLIQTPQVYHNRTAVTLVNDTSQQSLLGLTNGVAVTAGVRYAFVIKVTIFAAADSVNIFFANGGTATYSNTDFYADVGKVGFLGAFAPLTRTYLTLTSDGQIRDPKHISYGLTGGTYWETVIHGNIDVSGSGYLKPIIQFSPTPGANPRCVSGGYMEIYPIGVAGSSNTSIGNWS